MRDSDVACATTRETTTSGDRLVCGCTGLDTVQLSVISVGEHIAVSGTFDQRPDFSCGLIGCCASLDAVHLGLVGSGHQSGSRRCGIAGLRDRRIRQVAGAVSL